VEELVEKLAIGSWDFRDQGIQRRRIRLRYRLAFGASLIHLGRSGIQNFVRNGRVRFAFVKKRGGLDRTVSCLPARSGLFG
jgi:hypothetical protein